jgi:ABC-2 type transport system permease protein
MQYKASFFMLLIGQFLYVFTEFLGIMFMFTRFNTVDGFTLEQVMLCYAIVLMAFSLSQCFVRGFDMFPRMLGNGEFDRVLVRPRSTVFQVIASQMDFTRFGRLAQALIMMSYALPRSGVIWSPDKVLTVFLMIASGFLIFSGIFIVNAAFSFFTIEGIEFMNVLTDGGAMFGRYPFSIYGNGILGFLTFIVPLAAFQYYPLMYLLGRETGLLFMLAPLIGLVFLLPCYGFYRFGLSRFKSTGS